MSFVLYGKGLESQSIMRVCFGLRQTVRVTLSLSPFYPFSLLPSLPSPFPPPSSSSFSPFLYNNYCRPSTTHNSVLVFSGTYSLVRVLWCAFKAILASLFFPAFFSLSSCCLTCMSTTIHHIFIIYSFIMYQTRLASDEPILGACYLSRTVTICKVLLSDFSV